MADRTETVTYKVVVDDSGVPEEIRPRGAPRQFGTGHLVPRADERTPDYQRVQVRTLPPSSAQLMDQFARQTRAQATLHSIANHFRGAAGAAVGGNATGVLRGGLGAAGGIAQLGAGAAGAGTGAMFGSGAGLLVGAGLGLAAYAATRALTGLVGVVGKLSENFAHVNAGIAASQALVQVTQIQSAIRLAQATEPLIGAFNKLRVTVLETGTGVLVGLANRFGPMLEGVFGKIDSWIKDVAGHYGISLGSGPGAMTGKSLGQNAWNAALSARSFGATGGEMQRSIIGGTIEGGANSSLARSQQDLYRRYLQQREHVRAIDEQAAGGDLSPSQNDYVLQEHVKLTRLQNQYNRMRASLGKRYAGRGTPLGGMAPKIRSGDGDIPDPTTRERIDKIDKRIAQYTEDLNRPETDPFWTKDNTGVGFLPTVIQQKRARISQAINDARSERFKLEQKLKRHPSVSQPIPGLVDEELKLMQITAQKAVLLRDPVIGLINRQTERLYSPKSTHKDRMEALKQIRENFPHYGRVEQAIDEFTAAEKKQQGTVDAIRKKHLDDVMNRDKSLHHTPFSGVDVRQTVNFNLDMKLAHEKQVHDALSQVREALFGGFNTLRNETRLAVALLNDGGQMGVI